MHVVSWGGILISIIAGITSTASMVGMVCWASTARVFGAITHLFDAWRVWRMAGIASIRCNKKVEQTQSGLYRHHALRLAVGQSIILLL